MSQNKERSARRGNYLVYGIVFGIVLSALFALFVNPALIGVGIAIGTTIGLALEQNDEQG
jgi:uncharacterized membrane protein YgaE (UPF0421/DUF939 family)